MTPAPNAPWADLVKSYADWLRSKITFVELEHACEITTPFLDRHNDHLQIYAMRSDGSIVLTDDGHTIRDLEASGCDVRSGGRRRMFEVLLRGFGVAINNDELRVTSSIETFPQRKHALIQAMLAVNDMFMTARGHVVSLFLEDVEKFLRESNVRYVPNAEFVGRSGFHHKFDFIIPASPKAPERILRAINNPDRNSATAFLFSWGDTKDARGEKSQAYAFLNDQERRVASEVTTAISEYGAVVVPWSERERHVAALAA